MSKVVLRWILHGDHTGLLENKEINAFCDKRRYKPTGAYNPRITTEYIWDKDMVIDYYKKIKPSKLNLMALTEKCVILTLLATGARPSELRRLSLSALTVTGCRLNFIVPKTKTSRWNKVEDVKFSVELLRSGVKLKPAIRRVCPYCCIQQYIKATQPFRQSSKLFVTTTTGTPAARATIARWTTSAMKKTGIDTDMFKAYSTRSAAASKAAYKGLPLESVLKMGHWRQTSTFFKFYLRRVKYFSRSHQTPANVTKINLKKKNYSVVPASPARRVAAHSLRRILKKRYHNPIKPVYCDVPPEKQGFVNKRSRTQFNRRVQLRLT